MKAAPTSRAGRPSNPESRTPNPESRPDRYSAVARVLLRVLVLNLLVAAAKIVKGAALHNVNRGGLNAAEHATALAKLLTDAGQPAAVAEDFEFAWPKDAFASAIRQNHDSSATSFRRQVTGRKSRKARAAWRNPASTRPR